MADAVTAYFDKVGSDLHELMQLYRAKKIGLSHLVDSFDQIEQRLVWDCTLASSGARFPEDLRLAVNRVVLRYGIRTLPVNAVSADFETEDDHLRRLHQLNGAMHDVFHAVGTRAFAEEGGIPGYTDTPTTIIACEWFAPREEERERLAHAEFGGINPEECIRQLLGEGS